MDAHGRVSFTVVLVGALLAACTSGTDPEDMSSDAASAVEESTPDEATPSATVTEEAVDLPALAVEWLADPDFSARFDVSGFDEQPGGRSQRSGAGAIAGDDSELWVVDDLSGWDRANFLGDCACLVAGPGAATVRALASKVVDGVLYTKDHRGHWHESDAADPDTQPGHVFEMLREVETFDAAGTETIDGSEFTVLRPASPIAYDPTRLSMPAGLDDITVDTTVLVDEAGVPVRVALEVDATGHDYTLGVAYDLHDVGQAITVAPPADVWVPAGQVGFLTSDRLERDPILFEVPASWQPTGSDEGVLFTQSPDGSAVFVSFVVAEVNLEEELALIAEANSIDLDEVVQTDLHGLPSLLGTGTSPSGFGMAFSQALGNNLAFLAAWAGPSWDEDLQMAAFTEVLQTIELRNPMPGPAPGNTTGDPELQADTLQSVMAVAVVAAGDGCETADVMWTDVTGARWPEWTEDWYVDACGDLQIHEVTFTSTADGGTDISLSTTPFRYAEATSKRLPDGLADDPTLVASLLGDQPWLIDPALDLDEVAVAKAVQASQFGGSGLHVIILGSSLDDRFEDYFDTVFGRLGAGTLLLIDADSLIAESHLDTHAEAVAGAVEAAAERGTSNERIVEEFALALDPDVHGLD